MEQVGTLTVTWWLLAPGDVLSGKVVLSGCVCVYAELCGNEVCVHAHMCVKPVFVKTSLLGLGAGRSLLLL